MPHRSPRSCGSWLTRTVVNRLVPVMRGERSWENLQPLILAAGLMIGVLRSGTGLHQRLDSAEIRQRGPGVLRIAGVLRPSASGTGGGRPPADCPGRSEE